MYERMIMIVILNMGWLDSLNLICGDTNITSVLEQTYHGLYQLVSHNYNIIP